MLSLGRTKRGGSFLNTCQTFIIAEMLVYWKQADNSTQINVHLKAPNVKHICATYLNKKTKKRQKATIQKEERG